MGRNPMGRHQSGNHQTENHQTGNHQTGNHEWLLKRNCSLSPVQLAAWFGSLAFLSLLIALAFAAMGAWVVVPFAVLEVLALGVAFVMFGRHAADYERIVAEPGKLTIETSLGPRLERVEQSADWFRVEYSGRPRDLVQVVTARQSLPVGRFAPANVRPQLASELRSAFTGIRAGSRSNSNY